MNANYADNIYGDNSYVPVPILTGTFSRSGSQTMTVSATDIHNKRISEFFSLHAVILRNGHMSVFLSRAGHMTVSIQMRVRVGVARVVTFIQDRFVQTTSLLGIKFNPTHWGR